MLTQATVFATKKHSGQFRKSKNHGGVTLPYIFHPLEVTKLMWMWGIDDIDLLIAGVCHDLIEDTDVNKKDLTRQFNERVAGFVDEMTFIPPQNVKRAVSKAEYVATFQKKSIESLVLKLADRFCNVADYIHTDTEYANTYFHKADVLIQAWQDRKAEVIAKFGKKVQNRIAKTHTKLLTALKQPKN